MSDYSEPRPRLNERERVSDVFDASMEVEPSAFDDSHPSRMRSQSGGAGGVPVYVMLPLDTVSREGELCAMEQLALRLEALRDVGVEGVMIDVWWGIVERRAPGVYDWAPYIALANVLERLELKLHVVLSFHACGANRDDDYHVPLPPWVEDAVGRDPDGLLFQDKEGTRSDEYLSLWADDAQMPVFAAAGAADGARDFAGRSGTGEGLFPRTRDPSATPPGRDDGRGHQYPPRSPLECYRDLMRAFRATFDDRLRPGGLVTEVLVGCGPCGELRFPAYAMSRGWRFPGIGEFQCYDRRARESLARAAAAAGRPEWGKGGPHDAGTYNSRPDETGFFANGARVVGERRSVFAIAAGSNPGGNALFSSRSMLLPTTLAPDSPVGGFLGGSPPGGTGATGRQSGDGANPRAWAARARSLDDLTQEEAGTGVGAPNAPNGRWDSEYGRFFLGWYSGELAAHGERVMRAAGECFAGCAARLALKCAGIHWWYRTRSHAAELTTGYYNVQGGSEGGNSESAPFAKLGGSGGSGGSSGNDARRASLDWVPGGNRDIARGHPSFDGLGSPPRGGGLSENRSLGSFGSVADADELRESRGGAASFGANRPSGYDRVMAVAKSAGASVTFTCAEMSDREHDPEHKCGPEGLMRQVVRCAARHGVDVAAENALYRCDATAFKQMVRNCKRGDAESSGAGMTSFTFLRMCDSLFEEHNFRAFATFVRDLSGNDPVAPDRRGVRTTDS